MPYSFSCKYATKKKIKNTLVVPDLPEYAGLSKMGNFFYRLLKKFDVKYFYKSCKKIDSFVFFADNMKEKFDNDIRFITVECMVNPDMYTNQNEHESAIKHIVYTGGLEEEYGIKLLLDAFILINRDDYCLDICGSGNAANLVNDYANRYKGINFYGLVSSTEAFNLQMNAAVLVNPRPNNGIFTRFSFPSKNAEYLMTGIPTICFKLAGIPDEYDSLLYYFRSSDPKEMSEDIVKVCNISDVCRKEIFRKNREYMINYKNIKYQTKRIIDQLVGIDAR